MAGLLARPALRRRDQATIIFGSAEYERVVHGWLTINRILVALMIVFVALWIVVLLWSFF